MAFVIEINEEDDFADILRKFRATGTERDIVVRVAFDSLLLSELRNVQELKKRTDYARKRVRIQTADPAGAEIARQAGYEVQLAKPQTNALQQQQEEEQAQEQPQHSVESLFIPEPVSDAPVVRAEHQVYEPQPSPSAARQPKARRTTNRVLAVVFSIAMVILLLLAFVILPEADITVYAKTELLSRDMQITVDASATAVNVGQLVLPGTKLTNAQQFVQGFQSTGTTQNGVQASGTVTEFYNFTGHILKLGATTTTLTAGGATYHFTADAANIPVTKYFAGSTTNVDPSSLGAPVTVIADNAGESSNIPQGTRLEIKNTAFGSDAKTLWASSASAIGGGTTGAGAAVVSQSDLAAAGSSLQKSLLTATEQQLLASKQLTLLDSGSEVSAANVTFDHQAGAQSASFNGTINAAVNGLAFSKLDLVKLVEQRIAQSLDAGTYLITDQSTGNAETITESFRSYTPGSSNGVLMVHVDGIIASTVDTSTFASSFKGKNMATIQGILAEDQAVQGADIEFKPFWVRNAPRFLNKIYVTTKVKKPQNPDSSSQSSQ